MSLQIQLMLKNLAAQGACKTRTLCQVLGCVTNAVNIRFDCGDVDVNVNFIIVAISFWHDLNWVFVDIRNACKEKNTCRSSFSSAPRDEFDRHASSGKVVVFVYLYKSQVLRKILSTSLHSSKAMSEFLYSDKSEALVFHSPLFSVTGFTSTASSEESHS